MIRVYSIESVSMDRLPANFNTIGIGIIWYRELAHPLTREITQTFAFALQLNLKIHKVPNTANSISLNYSLIFIGCLSVAQPDKPCITSIFTKLIFLYHNP